MTVLDTVLAAVDNRHVCESIRNYSSAWCLRKISVSERRSYVPHSPFEPMLMQIHVHLLPELALASRPADGFTAVVIDVLRFTTTVAHALAAGALEVSVVQDVEIAREQAGRLEPRPLLCGERNCHPIAGFDLGNSPFDYPPQRVADQHLLFSTTNGTRAVEAAAQAECIVLASLVNRAAVCAHLAATGCRELQIYCAGTEGHVALEDLLAAGALIDRLQEPTDATPIDSPQYELMNDSALLALIAWHELAAVALQQSITLPSVIFQRLCQARGGVNLIEAGYEGDIEFAAQLDSLDVVPVARPLGGISFVAHQLRRPLR